ncbi:MAG TPA: hypothetical protein V6D26_00235 [Stenomitos sp.]
MQLNFLDRIGDWNPQVFREIKGRLNARNIAIAVASSLLGQLLLFLFWVNQIPQHPYYKEQPYCRLQKTFLAVQNQSYKLNDQYRQLQSQFKRYSSPKDYDLEKIQQVKSSIVEVKGKIQEVQGILKDNLCPSDAIDIQLWWHDYYPKMFMSLSVFVLFIMLGVGIYMLISNLAHEERRGTLNFIRLSPQSTLSVLGGKLLGVPILLYLAAIIAVPFHLWLGFSAQIPLAEICTFYGVLIASCAFFYSAALLFGLVTPWLGGFQSWLGSGAVLLFLLMIHFKAIDHTPMDWLNLFSPVVVLPYLVNRMGTEYTGGDFPFSLGKILNLEWFNLPIGATGISLAIFALLHYGLWTTWIWQALNRRFHNPNSTILSKHQSYWLVACFEVVTLGFVMGEPQSNYWVSPHSYSFLTNPVLLAFFHGVLFIGLIAILAPQRQALQDWARYRHEKVATRQGVWNRTLVQDLLWGEKSPEIVAIALNLAIAITPFLVWIIFLPGDTVDKTKAFLAVAFFVSLVMIYASVAQLMLLMKTNKRSLWAVGTIAALLVVPPMSLSILGIEPVENSTLWLLSTFPWAGLEHAATTTGLMAVLGEWSVLVLLNVRLTRQLQRAGESQTKALLAGRPVLPN